MSDRLQQILTTVRSRLRDRDSAVWREELHARASSQGPVRAFPEAVRRPGRGGSPAGRLRVIAELKRRSPSAGAIHEELEPVAAAIDLQRAGAAALSVLTEPDWFGGSLETLAQVRDAVDLPLLRKDFVIDPVQVLEARAYGADAVLLIAEALDQRALFDCREEARRWDLAVLAEAHDDAQLARLIGLDFPIIGVNARDLRSFAVDLPRALLRSRSVPEDRIVVIESGVGGREQVQQVVNSDVDAVLIGEGLMRGGTPGRRFVELFGQESP